jgi:hypothetical protein
MSFDPGGADATAEGTSFYCPQGIGRDAIPALTCAESVQVAGRCFRFFRVPEAHKRFGDDAGAPIVPESPVITHGPDGSAGAAMARRAFGEKRVDGPDWRDTCCPDLARLLTLVTATVRVVGG